MTIPMKITSLFLIVYCIAKVQGSYKDCSNIFTKCNSSKAVSIDKDPVNTTLLSDEQIDLSFMTPHTIRYYKYAAIIVCRVLDKFFFETRLEITNLTALEAFPELKDDSKRIKNLMTIITTVLTEYSRTITLDDEYLKKALYYNALKWLEIQTDDNNKIKELTRTLYLFSKAENYLYQIILGERLKRFVNLKDENLKKINGWKPMLDDEYSKAMLLIKKIALPTDKIRGPIIAKKKSRKDQPVTLLSTVLIQCKDLKIYEEILSNADIEIFQYHFQTDILNTLQLVDLTFDLQSEKDGIKSPMNDPIPTKTINLSDLEDKVVAYLKHATILFVQVFKEKFSVDFLSDDLNKELERYPHRYLSHSSLRYCAFQSFAYEVVEQLKKKFVLYRSLPLNPFSTFMGRSYLYRLAEWFNHTTKYKSDEHTECKGIIDERDRTFNAITEARHILIRVLEDNRKDYVFYNSEKNPGTLEQLKNLNNEIDDAVSTMMKITLDDLLLEEAQNRKKLSQANKHTEPLLDELRNKIGKTVYYKDTLLKFGKPDSKIKCRKLEIYEELLSRVNPNRFYELFRKTPQQMLSRVEKILTNTPVENLQADKRDEKTNDIPIESN